jgi:hypothetical protein
VLSFRIPYAAYPDARAAHAGLDWFLWRIGLPAPARVDCEDGIACYWALVLPVDPTAWLQCDRVLRIALRRLGLETDETFAPAMADLDHTSSVLCAEDDSPRELAELYRLISRWAWRRLFES